ncbi:hypothetical protein [Actinopolyspora mortivallis]|uniref:hypothetical protein n=1 Tax=Actinopolyspora mortivallis TaxID=33906 RepID=UPI001C6319B6|nr:hypothetical protein [Actinopolyspora mortivallis]
MSACPGLGLSSVPAGELDEISRMTSEAHRRYQSARYAATAIILLSLIISSPSDLSHQGVLFLVGSVIAGRRSDRAEATDRLRRAQYLADALGQDGNYGWTAFGPTNVAIHRVSSAAELGDAKHAIALAEGIDTEGLPEGLSSRRAQVHIDTAWAYSQHREDAAVVVPLMEAERMAPQALRYNVIVRELLREMLKRERRSATPGLRPLAQRAGVLQ